MIVPGGHSPSPWVVRWLSAIPFGGAVLDVACGNGRHVALLRANGRRVVAVDRDTTAITALAAAEAECGIEVVTTDLENSPWPWAGRTFAGVIATTKSTAPVFVQAWVKGRFASINVPNEQLKQRLQGVDWVTASANVTKDVTLNAVINTPDAAAAKQLGDLLGGAVLLLKLQAVAAAEDQPEMRPVVELLRSVRVNPKERTVVITGSVKGTEIEKALNPPPVSPAKK